MDNLILQKIKDLIDKNDKVGIAVGKNPTIDTMAAALSLYLGLQDYGKNPSVASGSQPLVEHSSLVGIDKVKGSFETGETATASGDLVVSFPYREGEIEKVSYTIEGGFLNIVVKAGQQGLTFAESDVKFRRGGQAGGTGNAPSLLFIVGTSRLSDLGSLFDTEALKNTAIVNLDNTTDNQGYGDVPAVSPDVASVSEMVAGLLYYLGIDVNEDLAQNLMYGINDGTNNMQDPRVSYATFELVANLMKKGANRSQQRSQQQRPAQGMPQQAQYPQRPQQGMGNRLPAGQGQYPRPSMPRQTQTPRPGGYQQRPPMMPRNPMPDPYAGQEPQFPGQSDPYGQQMPQPGNYNQGMPPMPRSGGSRGQGFDQSRGNTQGMDATQYGGPDYTQQENMQPEVSRRDAPQQGMGNRDAGQRFGGQQRPNQNNQPRRDQGQHRKPPSDWLTPKVYKGSTDVE